LAGYTDGPVNGGTWTITSPVAATPTFSPAAGVYSSAQSVTISDATAGATIYYTTDGTTPTTSSPVFSGSLMISASETVNAIATASGYSESAVGSATYTIGSMTLVQRKIFTNVDCTPTCPAQTVTSTGSGNLLFMSTTNANTYISSISCSPSCGSWTLPGAVCQQATDASGNIDCGYVISSTAGATSVTVTMSGSSGTQEIFFREYHTTSSAGFHFDKLSSTTNGACTSCITPTLSPLAGANDVMIAGGSPGHAFTAMSSPYGDVDIDSGAETIIGDLLNTSSGTGATITQNISSPAALYTIGFTDSPALPGSTFSPVSGTYTTPQTVTVSNSVSGVTECVTTDGSTPTETGHVCSGGTTFTYTGPITVDSTTEIRVLPTLAGYTDGSINGGTWTITP
jgi:hypothetical protein